MRHKEENKRKENSQRGKDAEVDNVIKMTPKVIKGHLQGEYNKFTYQSLSSPSPPPSSLAALDARSRKPIAETCDDNPALPVLGLTLARQSTPV